LRNALPYIAEMGFNVVYLPPIHPIGALSQRPQQQSGKPSRAIAAARGPSARPRAATNPSIPNSARSKTSADFVARAKEFDL
jgi:hypothetical protein